MRYKPIEERFATKYEIDPVTQCWMWTATKVAGGYGHLKLPRDGGLILAHRFSYQHHIGEVPAGMLVCHRCDRPSCVNPEHLFLATHQTNMKDMERKGRARVLSTKQVARLLKMLGRGLSQTAVAETIGVARSTVQATLTRAMAGDYGPVLTLGPNIGRYTRLTDKQRAEAAAMVKAGASIKSVAGHFNVDRKVIRKLRS